VRGTELLSQQRLTLEAHAQGIAREARQGEHLSGDLEDGGFKAERKGLLRATEGQTQVPEGLRIHAAMMPDRPVGSSPPRETAR
jgi:hypothetical protein